MNRMEIRDDSVWARESARPTRLRAARNGVDSRKLFHG